MRGLQGGILAGATALALGLAPLGAAIGADGLGDGTASVDCVPSMMESLVPAPTEREEGPSGGVSGELMESSGRTKSTTRATLKAQLKKRKRVAIIASIAIITLLALILVFVVIKKRGKSKKEKKEKKLEDDKAGTEQITRPESASENYMDDYLKNHLDQAAAGTDNLKEFLTMFHYSVTMANTKAEGEAPGAFEKIGSGRLNMLPDKIPHGREGLKSPGRKSLLFQTLYAKMPMNQKFTGTEMCRTQITDAGCLWYLTAIEPKNSPQDGEWGLAAIIGKLKLINDTVGKETRTAEELGKTQEKADLAAYEAKKASKGDELRPLYGNIVKEASARSEVCRWAATQETTKLGGMIDHEDFRCRSYGRGGEISSAQNDMPVADMLLRMQFKKQLDESPENVGSRALSEAWSGSQKFGETIEEQVKLGVRLQAEYEAAVNSKQTNNEIAQVAVHEYRQWHEIHEYGSVTAMALDAEMQIAKTASEVYRRLAIEQIQLTHQQGQAAAAKGSRKSILGSKKKAVTPASIPAVLNKTSYGLGDIDTLSRINKGPAAPLAQEAAFQLFKHNLIKAKLSYVTTVMAETNKKAENTLNGRFQTVFGKK